MTLDYLFLFFICVSFRSRLSRIINHVASWKSKRHKDRQTSNPDSITHHLLWRPQCHHRMHIILRQWNWQQPALSSRTYNDKMFKRRTSFKNEEADPLTREIPQGFPPPTTKRSSIRAESMRSSRKKEKKVAFLVLCVIVVIGVYVWLEDYELPRLRIEIEEEEIEPFIQQYEKVVSDNTLLNSELRTLKEKTKELTAAKKAIVLKLREMETANIAQVQLDNQNLRIQKDIMKKGIQQLSRRSVIEK